MRAEDCNAPGRADRPLPSRCALYPQDLGPRRAPRPVRVGEQVLYKLARRWSEQTLADRLLSARLSGVDTGTAPPRLLVRVDEFPHYQAWDEPDRFGVSRFARFHEIMAGAGVHYLVAILPRVSRSPLSPTGGDSRSLDDEETAVLRRLADANVCFALHGRDHRTRRASPRRHSELCGLDHAQTEKLIDEALAELERHDVRPDVFVPPFNRFDARQFAWLAASLLGRLRGSGVDRADGAATYAPVARR